MTASEHGPDIAVAGAGVSGTTCAVALSRYGFAVTLIDDQPDAGGQVFRAPSPYAIEKIRADQERKKGDRIRRHLAASGVDHRRATRLWGLTGRFELDLLGPDGMAQLRAERLVIANGAVERFLPAPGWTTPRVIGLAGASILLRGGGTLPGRSIVLAGSGPLLFSVAHQVLALGGKVAAIVSSAGLGEWIELGTKLYRDAGRLLEATQWMAQITAARIPIHYNARISDIQNLEDGVLVTICPKDRRKSSSTVKASILAYGDGLKPTTLLSRAAGAQHEYDPSGDYFKPVTDTAGRTDITNLYVTGDAAGIEGAEASRLRGLVTAHAIALDTGRITKAGFDSLAAPALRRLQKLAAISVTMRRLMRSGHDCALAIPDATILCRCEQVMASAARQAIAAGARDVNQVKAWTRCGMGPCQGRSCEDGLRQILMESGDISPQDTGILTVRSPFFPLPLNTISGEFVYDDIPLPKAAPL